MQFFSTRDRNRVVSASQAIAQGLSDEGGLFVPQSFPQVDVKAICALDYAEMAAAIADVLDMKLVIDDMDFDAALLSVQQGKADIVMAGVTVTDERKAVMDFSDSYATGIQSIIVPEGSDIASPDDLAGKKIGTQRGTTGYIYCSDDFGDENVVAYDDGLTAVQALWSGGRRCHRQRSRSGVRRCQPRSGHSGDQLRRRGLRHRHGKGFFSGRCHQRRSGRAEG